MFEVEKPRRFHYEPRFYDPEKEKWEAMKKRYAIEQERRDAQIQAAADAALDDDAAAKKDGENDELAYFEQRLKDVERQRADRSSQLGWRDMFRKREMPKFNYQPRFVNGVDTKAPTAENNTNEPASDAVADKTLAEKYRDNRYRIKIKRRFDISDTDYMKPISGTKIILYCFVVFLLISLIIAF